MSDRDDELNAAQLEVLRFLHHARRPIQTSSGSRLTLTQLDTATVAGTTATALEKRGLVQRRGFKVEITEAGREAIARAS